MKRLLVTALTALTLARATLGQPSPSYVNNTGVTSTTPPQIDATNFINNAPFNIGFLNLSSSALLTELVANNFFIDSTSLPVFTTADTLNYTNNSIMTVDTSFRFDTEPSGAGSRHMAANFVNASAASVFAGSSTNVFFLSTNIVFVGADATPQLVISATNVISPGLLDVGLNGLLKISGFNVNLNRGKVHVENAHDTASLFGLSTNRLVITAAFNPPGIFDEWWGEGRGTNDIFANFALPSPQSPSHLVTNIFFQQEIIEIVRPTGNIQAFANAFQVSPSNFTWQVVFVGNTSTNITTDCRFVPSSDFSIPVVQWSSVVPGNAITSAVTNNVYLADTFGAFTNVDRSTNFTQFAVQPTYPPVNYSWLTAFPGYGSLPAGNISFTPGVFVTNYIGSIGAYSGYAVTLAPTSQIPDPTIPESNLTNLPGRIEINATNVLDLTRARVTGANYGLINATNHFIGSGNAQIALPVSDIYLGSTNGVLAVTNLVAPFVPSMVGSIVMWSGKWTNVVTSAGAFNGTNRYHVFIVDSRLASTAPTLVQNLSLRSTNVYISDQLEIQKSFLVDATTLTITTNGPGAASPAGAITLDQAGISWPASLPRLQFLTNYGAITLPNAIDFEGIRQPPYFISSFTEPYQAMVNHGAISSFAEIIHANYFENSGTVATPATINATAGGIILQSATATLLNGTFTAPGDINISSGSLSASNHPVQAGGALTFSVTNSATDGGATNNLWLAGNGFNLLVKPATGDFLGTTVHNTAPPGVQVFNTWAGEDRGVSPAGYGNNVAIGHLILDGGDANSLFTFAGASATNALYVDLLELQNFATNHSSPNFTELDVDTNMMIYFADARIGNADISEKLDGANGGRIRWVPSYAGLFSSTNITYPSGRTYTFNIALVQSGSLDSDGDGIPNSADPTPIFTADDVAFSVQLTNQPPGTVLLSWESLFNSTNFLYFKSSLAATNWTVVTNFVQGPVNTRVTVADQVRASGPGFYQVRVDAAQP